MGDAYIRLRKYKEAIEALVRVTELSKPEVVIYEAIGHCYDRLKNYAQARFYYRKASHLNQEDKKLFYKIACTYFNEGQWESCIKQVEQALKIHRTQPEYNLLMGECKMELGLFKDAVHYFSTAVQSRPRNVAGREALIRCLYTGELHEEAMVQAEIAQKMTNGKPVFLFYKAAILLAMGKNKEAILQLEKGLTLAPRLLKKFIELSPASLQNQQIVDVLARFKRNKSI
jgi:tetratricopeptide (TPR) repeat protein